MFKNLNAFFPSKLVYSVIFIFGLYLPITANAVPISYISELINNTETNGFYQNDITQSGAIETSNFYSFFVSQSQQNVFGYNYSSSPGYTGVLKIYSGLYSDTSELNLNSLVNSGIYTFPYNGSMASPLAPGFYTLALNSYNFQFGLITPEPSYSLRVFGISPSSTVPEPKTCILMFVGLLCIIWRIQSQRA